MTREDIATMLSSIGLPFAYDHFEPGEAVDPPFIVFTYPGRADFLADGSHYVKIANLNIELYTDEPDFALEQAVETALDNAGLVYDQTGPTYISEERMYETLYETSTILEDSNE